MAKPHEILGVAVDASLQEVQAAYRRLAREHHPDKGGDIAQFQRVAAAFRALRAKSEAAGLFDDLFTDIAKEMKSG